MENSNIPVSAVMTKTLVCIDNYDDKIPTGAIYNPFLEKPCKFCGTMGMIICLDKIMDTLSFPQRAMEYRTFLRRREPEDPTPKHIQRYMSDDVIVSERGKVASFIVQVQFRQSATWQGTLQWMEQKSHRHFRSALEMLRLMDAVLEHGQAGAESWQDADEPDD